MIRPMPVDRFRDDLVWADATIDLPAPIYGIEDRPASIWEALLYGWQHTLVDISPFILPLAVASALGLSLADQARFINYVLFAMGVATLLQTTIGNRLPIIQGPSATLIGTLTPLAAQAGAAVMWGAAFAGGVIEMLIGASGLLRPLRRLLPPAVSGVVIVTIGLSLGNPAVRLAIGDGAPRNLLFAGTSLALIFLLQIKLATIAGGLVSRAAIFLSIWCVGLGLGSLLGEVNWSLVAAQPWFELPRFAPWGAPGMGWELSIAAVLVVMAGYLGSIVESLGDYAATCAVSREPYRVRHMTRGIFAEGLGSAMATLLGGLPCTSYTQNIGIIATTRVASRFVVRLAAGVLILYGLSPKLGALLVAMPRSVLGGVFLLICGSIVISGVRLLAAVPPTAANTAVVGITLVLALALPPYVENVLGSPEVAALPLGVRLLITNSVVLAVLTSVTLNLLLNELMGGASGSPLSQARDRRR